MIQPAGYSIISPSLSTTLKVSVTLNDDGTFGSIEVHLYDQYQYSLAEMEGMWQTIDVARHLPGFESAFEIDMYVHARPDGTATALGGGIGAPVDSEQEGDDGHVARRIPSERFANLPTPSVDVWLQAITLNIRNAVKLEFCDYLVLSTHIMVMLRPYAVTRLEKGDDKMGCPKFRMFSLQTDVLLNFTAAVSLIIDQCAHI